VLTLALILVSVLAVAGGVVAVAAPDPRPASVGAFGAVLLAALIVDPMPSGAAVIARIAGACLGGWLVWMALRPAPRRSANSALGWLGAAGTAAAAYAIGWLAASALGANVATGVGDGLAAGVPGATLAGGSLVARAAVAAAAALLVLGAAPVVLPRDGHRLGLGIALLLGGTGLLVAALGAGPDDVMQLTIAVLVALTGAATAAVTTALLKAGGDLALRDAPGREPAVRHRAADDAHRGAVR
jgi:hypothetical protein